jgi:hypothetical protein
MNPNTELLLLSFRSLVSDKELLVSQANHDLAKFGEWRCNYTELTQEVNAAMQSTLDELRKVK